MLSQTSLFELRHIDLAPLERLNRPGAGSPRGGEALSRQLHRSLFSKRLFFGWRQVQALAFLDRAHDEA